MSTQKFEPDHAQQHYLYQPEDGNNPSIHQLLLLLSRFSRVRLCATPETAASQAPPSLDSPGKNTGVGCHFLLQCMKGKVKVKSLSRVRPSATPWTAAFQAPPSMGFSRQEYWSGVPSTDERMNKIWHISINAVLFSKKERKERTDRCQNMDEP